MYNIQCFFLGPMGPKFGLRILAPKNLGAAPKFGLRKNLGEAQKNLRKKFCKVKMRNEYSVFIGASKRKFILAAVEDMKRRTANAAKGLKNFDLTHKITRRKEAEVKLKSLKKFIPDLDVPAVTQQYLALITSLGNSPENSSIISKLQFAIRTGGYENIIPVFQLALSSIG